MLETERKEMIMVNANSFFMDEKANHMLTFLNQSFTHIADVHLTELIFGSILDFLSNWGQ